MITLEGIGFSKILSRNYILAFTLLNFFCIGYLFKETQSLHKEHKMTENRWIDRLVECDSMRVVDYINLRMEIRTEKDGLIKELLNKNKR